MARDLVQARRRHSALAYLAPLEYERRWQMTYDYLGAKNTKAGHSNSITG
ncbi:MAG TPA: hypothetical protein VF965_04255 [Candidatus Limnocylindria bacterium]